MLEGRAREEWQVFCTPSVFRGECDFGKGPFFSLVSHCGALAKGHCPRASFRAEYRGSAAGRSLWS